MTEADLYLPPNQPPTRLTQRVWLGLLGAVLAAAGWWWSIGQHPAPFMPVSAAPAHASPDSSLRRAIVERGVLQVALRSYPRPSLPDAPLEPEPDVLDLAYAHWLGAQLGVPVQWKHEAPALLQLQAVTNASTESATGHAASGYGDTHLQLVALRQQIPHWHPQAPTAWRPAQAWRERWPWLSAAWTALHPSTPTTAPLRVCIGQGLAPSSTLQAHDWQVRLARSSVHAISDFLAGQCDALAETPAVIARLLSQSSWRFYAPLGSPWAVAPSTPTTPDDAWLQFMQQRWLTSTARQQALHNRTSTIALEASMLEDGAICH